MWDTNGGVYLGYGSDRTEGKPPKSAPVIQYAGDRHIMTLGPNGSGKTKRLLAPNLMGLINWSMVVVDPNGELATACARRRDPELRNTIFLNPFGIGGIPSHGFNPVAALDPASPEFPDDALELAEALIRAEGDDAHWAASAQDLVAALLMYSRLTQKDGGGFQHVRECLARRRDDFVALIADMMTASDQFDCPELAIKAARYGNPESPELNRVLSIALAQSRWLDSRPVRAGLETGDPVDFGVIKDKATTVFLILPARRIGMHSTWLRLMIASILQPLIREARPPKVPVLLMLDEYAAIAQGGFPIVEDNIATFRDYGIKLWTVWQDLGQARRLYGDGFESFVSNCGVLQSFAPRDVMTAEYLSQHTGLTALEVESQSRSASGGFQPVPRMLPQDLRNMDEGYAVLFTHLTKNTVRAHLPFPGLGWRRNSIPGFK